MTDFNRVLRAMGVGNGVAATFALPIDHACVRFEIRTPDRQAAFLAQMAHESQMFRRLVENLNYSDPVRIVKIFRKAFDLDNDRVIDQEEIEFAKGYVREPIKLASRAYANRMGNGDEASGDGWRYRGRGGMHCTGKANYEACGAALGLQLLAHPELLEQPDHACMSAAWFWKSNGCNELADAGMFNAITKKINGGMNGSDERRALWIKARKAMGL